SGRAKLRNGSWRRWSWRRPRRRPRFPRAQRIPRPLSWDGVIVAGPWWGPWWGYPPLLPALLLPAAGRGGASTGHRGGPTAAGILVLLSQRQSLLPDGSNVPRAVDQSPAAQTVEPRAPTRCRGLAVSNRAIDEVRL